MHCMQGMRLGRFVETICGIFLVLLVATLLLALLLVAEVINFIFGQPISLLAKISAFAYVGAIFCLTIYLIAAKLYNLRQS